MILLHANMPLSEVVEHHTSLIPVINRFGIRLGLGDKTVETICKENELDTGFFIAVINTFLNEDYFPEKKLQTFHTSQIIDYLTKTNVYYQRFQLANIERHLGSFISMSAPGNQSLIAIGKFFNSFRDELTARIQNDTENWFPYCKSLDQKLKEQEATETAMVVKSVSPMEMDDPIESLLADLKRLMIKHLSGEYEQNLCYAVIFALSSLEKDIRQHNRIRYRILVPMVTAIEERLNR